jgi:hypothetical protein
VQTSIFLARLLGPLLLILGASLFVNGRTFRALAKELVDSALLVVLFGFMDFAAGLAIVLTHNVWVASWRVLVTLIGWLLLIRGAVRILVPDVRRYAAKHIGDARLYMLSSAVFVILGLVLCYFGYVA